LKLFFAGAEPKQTRRLLKECNANKFLVSYYSFRKQDDLTNEDVFLDSGAFTAFTQNKEIDIQKYIGYLKKHKEKFSVYANLDVIGDPEATLKNQQIIEKAGLNPLPTFHYGSDIKYLRNYIDNYGYIALGGLVPLTRKPVELINWLNYCFSFLIKPIKEKGLKIHGLGMTSSKILIKYPFYSVDGTSWLCGAKFGTVIKWEKYKMQGAIHLSHKEKFIEAGLNLKLAENDNEKSKHNIIEFLKMEKDITELWKKRGIEWKD